MDREYTTVDGEKPIEKCEEELGSAAPTKYCGTLLPNLSLPIMAIVWFTPATTLSGKGM